MRVRPSRPAPNRAGEAIVQGVGESGNRFTPVHRHIAEFLGARYLARIIHDGLPARRVIALITGEDGTVVTELRGLSAWLAAHCQDARADLIERIPSVSACTAMSAESGLTRSVPC